MLVKSEVEAGLKMDEAVCGRRRGREDGDSERGVVIEGVISRKRGQILAGSSKVSSMGVAVLSNTLQVSRHLPA